ncbi:MAG: hypothetical protein IKG22_07445 [Atopobiaceae bacterium]|nr:hypothetical protein [Atopobiaceae bacterium]
MHKTRSRIGALIAALGVALAFVLCGVVARAAEDYTFKLTVGPAKDTTEAVRADMDTAGIVVDVYQMATAEEDPTQDAFIYTWNDNFKDVQADYELLAKARTGYSSDWQALYADAAKLVVDGKLTADVTGKFGDIELDSKGLYLVIAHGTTLPAGEEMYDSENGYAGVAFSGLLKYSFPPTMVAAPTKDVNADGVIVTDWVSGDWKDEAEIFLKSSYDPLFGSLIINKTVDEYDGKPVTFTYHIYDTKTGGKTYENYAAITYDGQTSTTVTHIPAGLEVTVDESYEGARYQAVGPKTANATIVSDVAVELGKGETASVAFENAPDGDHTDGGYGIENHFDYTDPNNPQNHWPWSVTSPADWSGNTTPASE